MQLCPDTGDSCDQIWSKHNTLFFADPVVQILEEIWPLLGVEVDFPASVPTMVGMQTPLLLFAQHKVGDGKNPALLPCTGAPVWLACPSSARTQACWKYMAYLNYNTDCLS